MQICGAGLSYLSIFPLSCCKAGFLHSPVKVLSSKKAHKKKRPFILFFFFIFLPFFPPRHCSYSQCLSHPYPNTVHPAVPPCASQCHQPPSRQQPHSTDCLQPRKLGCKVTDGAPFNSVPEKTTLRRSGRKYRGLVVHKVALGKHRSLPHISLGPYGKGKADGLSVDRLVTHQDRDRSQLPSESVQGDSKSCGEGVSLSLTGLSAHRILYHSYLLQILGLSWH